MSRNHLLEINLEELSDEERKGFMAAFKDIFENLLNEDVIKLFDGDKKQ